MTRIDVSTRAAVVHYLRSINVSAKGVVIQRGALNYAGAHCPGARWTCASTRHTVVQIAERGGQNRFVCRRSSCTIIQISGASPGFYIRDRQLAATKPPPPPPGTNLATCVKTTGITQSCVINQPNASGTNKAVVWMVTPKVTGLTQSSNYSASITQGPASAVGSSNINLACVRQFVWIDGSTTKTNATSTTVTNDNHESISIQQNSLTGTNTVEGATPSGASYDCDTSSVSQLQQDEQLTSVVTSKGSITQNQNTATTGKANVVVDIEQNQDINGFSGFFGHASGTNNAAFEQSTKQVAIANTPSGTVTQQQGANVPFPPGSGLVGTINQDSSNISTASATQTETQCEDAVNMTVPTPPPGSPPTCPVTDDPGPPAGVTLTQTQYGPEGFFNARAHGHGRVLSNHKGYGASKQTGRPQGGDSFTLHQTSTQNTDGAGPHTTITQSNIIQGDCQSDGGSCEARQTATLNGQDTKDGYTAPRITDPNPLGGNGLVINCSNGHGSCNATPPPAPAITSHPTDPSESTSATFGWTEAATAQVTLKCSIDGGTTFTDCDSPTSTSYSNLSLHSHTFVVKAVDNFANESATDSFTWTIVPYLTFEATNDGASAGWTGGVPGSSIDLKVGSDSGTYAQFTLHNFEGIAVSGLAEPTFAANTYVGGSPRYEIDFSDGNYVFGYPPVAGFPAPWTLITGCPDNCTTSDFESWSAVQGTEGSATVTAALIQADFGVSPGDTYTVTGFTFAGYGLSDFSNHYH